MINPQHPTEKYIRGRIAFHKSQVEYFDQHDRKMAEWARLVLNIWEEKLEALKGKTKV